ncbi:uncharacterized protein LOC113351625 [Papaver somniferum]|uniref:uncharacterized protein LOC113351625 n=1 Tax=Papaver somniferum TaxID=3469 RepID=UPI000E702A75|nr:uncharacterized protein LOC113351625 [Papaver somniferum]
MAPLLNQDRRMVVATMNNPQLLNQRDARGNRRSDLDYNPEDSDYFYSEIPRPGRSTIHQEHQQAMENLRTEMMAEIKYFPSSLKGSVLSWFDNLPPDSIDSYDQLTEKFLATYMYNKIVNTGMDKLFSLTIRYKETIRMSPLFVEIHGTIRTIEGDLRVIIEKHARLDEIQSKNPRAQTQRPHRTNSVEQASGSKRGGSGERLSEDRKERRDDRRREDRKFEDQVYTRLDVSYSRILREIKGRENLEWPWSKGKQPPRSEKSKEYCEYHCFSGHQTKKCKNLKIMIQKLIDAGDLK